MAKFCVAVWEPLRLHINCVAEYLEFRYNFEINPRSDYIFLVEKRPNYYFKEIVLSL